jgi:hypothetical protein
LLGVRVHATTRDTADCAAVAVISPVVDLGCLAGTQVGEGLPGAPAPRLLQFRRVDLGQSNLDLAAVYQQGHGVTVMDAHDAADRLARDARERDYTEGETKDKAANLHRLLQRKAL